jgi:DNA ligase-1
MKPNLAETPDPKYPLTWPKYVSVKLDGIRGTTQVGTTLTRASKLLPNQEMRESAAQVQGLDGEFIFGAPNAPDVYHRTYSAVMTANAPADGILYYVFDTLDRDLTFHQRYEKLKTLTLPYFCRVLPQTLVQSQAELELYYQQVLEQGYEGLILRNPGAMYKEGRSTAKSQDMLKLKPFLDSDAMVLDVYEAMHNDNPAFINELGYTDRSTHQENLRASGMIGGFIVDFKGQICRVAAGKLTHHERIAIFQNPATVIGQWLKFRHLPIGVKDAPRHARFIGWRSPLDL